MPQQPLADPADPWLRAKGLGKAIPASAFLLSTLLAGNAAQTASLLAKPISRRAFRRFNRWVADLWWGWCVTVGQQLHGARLELSGDVVPPEENAIVVVNHQQMPDITFLMLFARSKERLGDMKWFVKDAIKYVPGVGWGMLFLDCVFVKRDWAEDRASVERTFSRIVSDEVPLWLLTFAEGTRITPEKARASNEYARSKGIEPFSHVLLPRTKGFVASVRGLRGHVDAVYDLTIGYERGVPTLWQYIQGFAPVAHLHVRRYPISELSEDDAELAEWLMERYREKDRLLERFYREGRF